MSLCCYWPTVQLFTKLPVGKLMLGRELPYQWTFSMVQPQTGLISMQYLSTCKIWKQPWLRFTNLPGQISRR